LNSKVNLRGQLRETPTGLAFDAPLSREDWSWNLKLLERRHNSTLFATGDLINYGFDNYGEGDTPEVKRKSANQWCYSIASEVCGLQVKTLWNVASICRLVAADRRIEAPLTFSHHAAVAALSDRNQEKFLALAQERSMSVADLREAIRQSQSGPATALMAGHSSPFLAWLAAGRRLIQTEDLVSLPADQKAALQVAWALLRGSMDAALNPTPVKKSITLQGKGK
jgi:hypothetical protein